MRRGSGDETTIDRDRSTIERPHRSRANTPVPARLKHWAESCNSGPKRSAGRTPRVSTRDEGYQQGTMALVAGQDVPIETQQLGGEPRSVDALQDLVVVSHRGPVAFESDESGIRSNRSGGGLVTALVDLVRHAGRSRWICAAATEADREVATHGPAPLDGTSGCEVEMLVVEPDAHHGFYSIIANPILWFVQHYLWDHVYHPEITASERRAWDDGYVTVNRQFANATINAVTERNDAALRNTIVMVHDYHFYLVPSMIRESIPDAFVHFFVHIPWPQPDAWRVLTPTMRDALLEGLLGSDLVAFHTERYARNFLLTCQELLDLDVDFTTFTVRHQGREIAARHYPISVDEMSLRELAKTPEAEAYERELDRTCAGKLMLRVDRTDPSKNIVRGFRAYDLLLEKHPELCGAVTFLAHLQPSRQDVPEYVQYLEAILSIVTEVNQRHGRAGWRPIDLRIEHNLPLAVAGYRRFDVLVVNSIFDGMNLVAKEAIVLNERNGVLALSENTGAHEELGAVAVTLHPFDLEQQADAFWEALTMTPHDRQSRHEAAYDIVQTNNVDKWLAHQIADVEALRASR